MIEAVREFVACPDPTRFDELALRVFACQYEGNEPYRRFCDRRGRSPANVRTPIEIPAVPIAAFKEVDLVVGGLGRGAVYRTSGTTRGPERRGRHFVPDPSLYRAAALAEFRRWVLPDNARPRFVVFAPSVAEEPESSLCQMIDWLAEDLAPAPAEYFVRSGALEVEPLIARLRELETTREPVLLIGVTHAFIGFFDACAPRELRFRLPYASRVVDTGGTKGRSRPMSRAGLLRAYWELFGVAGYFVSNEYGMTEMSSQFYDDSIRNHVEGVKSDRAKHAPPWVRTWIVSPETLLPVAPGERGLLRHLDLVNVGSVAALVTEDVGVA
ncbi:MAG: long-chain fatty acid--CoA ligase, partial [Candidatus Binatia bacterium]